MPPSRVSGMASSSTSASEPDGTGGDDVPRPPVLGVLGQVLGPLCDGLDERHRRVGPGPIAPGSPDGLRGQLDCPRSDQGPVDHRRRHGQEARLLAHRIEQSHAAQWQGSGQRQARVARAAADVQEGGARPQRGEPSEAPR